QAAAAGGARQVVHGVEARTRIDAAVEVQDELGDELAQIIQRPRAQAAAPAEAFERVVAARAFADGRGLDTAFRVAVEAFGVVPEHHRPADVDRLSGHDDGRADGEDQRIHGPHYSEPN